MLDASLCVHWDTAVSKSNKTRAPISRNRLLRGRANKGNGRVGSVRCKQSHRRLGRVEEAEPCSVDCSFLTR